MSIIFVDHPPVLNRVILVRKTGKERAADGGYQRPGAGLCAEDHRVGGAVLLRLRVGLHVRVLRHHADHCPGPDHAAVQQVHPARGDNSMWRVLTVLTFVLSTFFCVHVGMHALCCRSFFLLFK